MTIKVLSNREDPGRSVAAGLGDRHPDLLCHGTTIATNALLERRGVAVALVTNRGFADVIEIARQDRPSLYDQSAGRPEPLVPRDLRFGVRGRLDASGREIEPVDVQLPTLAPGVDVAAVCLLHADLEPAHERAVAAALAVSGAILLEGDVFSAQLFKFRPQMPGRPIVAPLDNGAVNFGPPHPP